MSVVSVNSKAADGGNLRVRAFIAGWSLTVACFAAPVSCNAQVNLVEPGPTILAPTVDAKPKKPRHHPAGHHDAKADAQTHAAVQQAAPAAASPPAPQPTAEAGQSAEKRAIPDLASELRQNGAGGCADAVNIIGAASLPGVTSYRTAANWAMTTPNEHVVNLAIGERYGAGRGVPYGAVDVVAAPGPQGQCDAVSVQVIPSQLPCAKLGDVILKHGKMVADLTGVALLQDASQETMLVPTGGNTCVLVGIKAAYAK